MDDRQQGWLSMATERLENHKPLASGHLQMHRNIATHDDKGPVSSSDPLTALNGLITPEGNGLIGKGAEHRSSSHNFPRIRGWRFALLNFTEDTTLTVRFLLWANAISLMFIMIAAVGVTMPMVSLPTDTPPEPMPAMMEVLLPEPEMFIRPTITNDTPVEPAPDDEILPDLPDIVPMIAVAHPASVNFPVQIESVTPVVNAKFATPPPPQLHALAVDTNRPLPIWQPRSRPRPPEPPPPAPPLALEPEITRFVRGRDSNGHYPEPRYPLWAQHQGIEGQIELLVYVDKTGMPTRVEIKKNSPSLLLDDYVKDQVAKRWRWMPGSERLILVPFNFVIEH